MSATSDLSLPPASAYLRLALISAAAAVAAVLVGYLPTQRLAGPDGVGAMLLGVGIALLAALAGLVPPLLALRHGPRERLNGVLTGMAIRFMLTLALLLAALLSGRLPKMALALWVAIGYLVLLAVDTAGVLWLMKRAERAST